MRRDVRRKSTAEFQAEFGDLEDYLSSTLLWRLFCSPLAIQLSRVVIPKREKRTVVQCSEQSTKVPPVLGFDERQELVRKVPSIKFIPQLPTRQQNQAVAGRWVLSQRLEKMTREITLR